MVGLNYLQLAARDANLRSQLPLLDLDGSIAEQASLPSTPTDKTPKPINLLGSLVSKVPRRCIISEDDYYNTLLPDVTMLL